MCIECIYKNYTHHKNMVMPKQHPIARKRNRDFVKNYKKDKCCQMCGWNEHPQILEFHHTDPKNKYKTVNLLTNHPYSIKTIIEEINKCILLCPNCHRWHSYKDQSKEGD